MGYVSYNVCRQCRQQLKIRSNIIINPSTTRALSSEQQRILPPAYPPPSPPPAHLDPLTVTEPRHERKLLRHRVFPVGSRRRRTAMQSNTNIAFEQLPYQCFQEALNVLREDRQEKVNMIEHERERIRRLQQKEIVSNDHAAIRQKASRLHSMRRHLEYLKVQADINDPLVKKRFEDGKADLSKPIYRHLALQKFQQQRKLLFEQRIHQLKIVPDIIPTLPIHADVSLHYHGTKVSPPTIGLSNKEAAKYKNTVFPRPPPSGHHRIEVSPGEFVSSIVSINPPLLEVQVFNSGKRYVTVVVVDPDIPDVENDRYRYRALFIGVNIPISPAEKTIRITRLDRQNQIVLPWIPPTAQKGSPYHRIATMIFEQPRGESEDAKLSQINAQTAKERVERENFITRSFADRHRLTPIGGHIFRTRWDQWMEGVVESVKNVSGGKDGLPTLQEEMGMELKRKEKEVLPYKKRDTRRLRG